MGARTIDEGAMDEKSGMNFSEYMAILSGNTDLMLPLHGLIHLIKIVF